LVNNIYGGIVRLHIIIDDKLIAAALKTSGYTTKKEAVEEALKLLVQVKKRSHVKLLRDKLPW
jgi:Arc/MetJ family transcription regulator